MTMNPQRSLRGRNVGLDYADVLQAQIGVRSPRFIDDVNVATTGSTLPNGGTSRITSTGAAVHALADPILGVVKRIWLDSTSTSTAARTVAAVAASIMSTASSTYGTMTFNGMGQSITLEGLSTSRWGVLQNAGVALS